MLLHNVREFLVAFDQMANVLVSMLTFRRGYSDETLSAHAFRSYRDGKVWGRIFLPIIDFLFSWQKQEPGVSGHCHGAYLKEKARAYLPAEYR
jgi:hypothetical protein